MKYGLMIPRTVIHISGIKTRHLGHTSHNNNHPNSSLPKLKHGGGSIIFSWDS